MTSLIAVVCFGTLAFPQNTSMFRNDEAHSGLYAGGVSQFHGVRWKFHTDGEVNSSPAVVDGVVFVGSNDGNLYAIDQSTGSQRWHFATESRIPSSPAVANGVVYFGSYDGNFYAVDAVTGKLRWRFATPGERRFAANHLHGSLPVGEIMPDPFDVFLSSPVISNRTVYFGSGDGNIYALDAATGALRWKFKTGAVVHASPAIANGRLFVGSWDSFFYAIDVVTGKEVWRFKTGEDHEIYNQTGIQSSATVDAGTVYFGCRDSNLYALDAATGEKRWVYNNKGSWVITSPVVHDGRVYFATADTATLHVVDARNGADISSPKFKWPFFASPSIAGDVLYLAGQDGKLVALGLTANQPLWTFQSDGSVENLASLSNASGGPKYEAVFSSNFYDDLIVGVSKIHRVGMFLSSPVIAGNYLYIGSTDGNLYALE